VVTNRPRLARLAMVLPFMGAAAYISLPNRHPIPKYAPASMAGPDAQGELFGGWAVMREGPLFNIQDLLLWLFRFLAGT
jgi:hypothetical protein